MSEIILTDDNFEAEVEKAKGVVLVDFWAEWCSSCRMLGPIVEEVAQDIGDKAKVVKVNVDQAPKTTEKYNVMSLPTVIIFKSGKVAETLVGVQPGDVMLEKLKGFSEK